MLSVWSTAPIDGTARYASRCSWLFQEKVPTRSSPLDPELPEGRSQLVAPVGLDYLGVARTPSAALRYGRRYPLPGEAAGQVVVHQAAGLHRGVRGDRPGEDEAMLAQLGGQRLRGGGL